MKVGIFTSCLVSDASEHSVWTVPALAVLVPAVEAALWRLQPAPTLPPSAEEYVGTYGPKDARVTVAIEGGNTLVADGLGGGKMNLTALAWPDAGDGAVGPPHTLRARPVPPVTTGCRWLDDGSDLELVEFEVSGGKAQALSFMGGKYGRVN